MNPNRPKLSDLLANSGAGNIRDAWNTTQAAAELSPIPPGEYICHVVSGEGCLSRSSTPGFKSCFRVIEGEHSGRKVWHNLWLTVDALPMAKRDLAKLGIKDLAQLDEPLPYGIRCKVRVTRKTGDDGRDYNDVQRFETVGIDPPPANPFPPPQDLPDPEIPM